MPSDEALNRLRLEASRAAHKAQTMHGLPNEIDRQEGYAFGLQTALDILAAATKEDDRG